MEASELQMLPRLSEESEKIFINYCLNNFHLSFILLDLKLRLIRIYNTLQKLDEYSLIEILSFINSLKLIFEVVFGPINFLINK
jgi:hypothetical protein